MAGKAGFCFDRFFGHAHHRLLPSIILPSINSGQAWGGRVNKPTRVFICKSEIGARIKYSCRNEGFAVCFLVRFTNKDAIEALIKGR